MTVAATTSQCTPPKWRCSTWLGTRPKNTAFSRCTIEATCGAMPSLGATPRSASYPRNSATNGTQSRTNATNRPLSTATGTRISSR